MNNEILKTLTEEELKILDEIIQAEYDAESLAIVIVMGFGLFLIISWYKRLQQKRKIIEYIDASYSEERLANKTFSEIINNPEFEEKTYMKELVRLHPERDYKEILIGQLNKFESLRTEYIEFIELEGFQEEHFNQIMDLLNLLLSNCG